MKRCLKKALLEIDRELGSFLCCARDAEQKCWGYQGHFNVKAKYHKRLERQRAELGSLILTLIAEAKEVTNGR